MPEKTRFMDIYKHLDSRGVEVYSPGQKTGECLRPYTVIKDAGTTPYNSFSSTRTLYNIMCYMPKDRFTALAQYVEEVKGYMRELWPMIMPLHSETEAYYDEDVNGYMVTVQYYNNRKMTY